MVYSTKMVLNPYKTPEKALKMVPKQEERKAQNILSAFLSKNTGQLLQVSQSLCQMNTNHQKGRGHQQETACYTLKKNSQSKFMPVLKDKKHPYPNIHNNPYSPMVRDLIQGRLSECKNEHSSRASSKPQRESVLEKKSANRKRLSDFAKPNYKPLTTHKKKRPPLHNNYFNNTLIQEKEVLRTFESNESMEPPKEATSEDLGDFGTEEGVPHKALDIRLQEEILVTGRSAQQNLLYNDEWAQNQGRYQTSKNLDQHYLDLVRMDTVTLQPSVKLREKDEIVVGVKGENLRLFRKTKNP